MIKNEPYKYKLRPGYQSKELLIEIFSGIDNENFLSDFKHTLIEIELIKKEVVWVNDEILYHFNSIIGKYTITSSNWDLVFINAEDHQNGIKVIDQILIKNPKFEKIEVDFDEEV